MVANACHDSAASFRVMSFMTLATSCVALMRGDVFHWHIMCIVWAFSYAYWTRNDDSWLRYADILVVQYGFWMAWWVSLGACENALVVYRCMALVAVVSFALSLWARYHRGLEHLSTVMHCWVYYMGNVGNAVLIVSRQDACQHV
jgi:hypothetical protein